MSDLTPAAPVVPTPTRAPDTPPTGKPPTRWDKIKVFFGDLARPFAIYVSAGSAAIATVRIVERLAADHFDQLAGAAIYITAAWGGVAALYGVKEWGAVKAKQADADVQKTVANANAQSSTTP